MGTWRRYFISESSINFQYEQKNVTNFFSLLDSLNQRLNYQNDQIPLWKTRLFIATVNMNSTTVCAEHFENSWIYHYLYWIARLLSTEPVFCTKLGYRCPPWDHDNPTQELIVSSCFSSRKITPLFSTSYTPAAAVWGVLDKARHKNQTLI